MFTRVAPGTISGPNRNWGCVSYRAAVGFGRQIWGPIYANVLTFQLILSNKFPKLSKLTVLFQRDLKLQSRLCKQVTVCNDYGLQGVHCSTPSVAEIFGQQIYVVSTKCSSSPSFWLDLKMHIQPNPATAIFEKKIKSGATLLFTHLCLCV